MDINDCDIQTHIIGIIHQSYSILGAPTVGNDMSAIHIFLIQVKCSGIRQFLHKKCANVCFYLHQT